MSLFLTLSTHIEETSIQKRQWNNNAINTQLMRKK